MTFKAVAGITEMNEKCTWALAFDIDQLEHAAQHLQMCSSVFSIQMLRNSSIWLHVWSMMATHEVKFFTRLFLYMFFFCFSNSLLVVFMVIVLFLTSTVYVNNISSIFAIHLYVVQCWYRIPIGINRLRLSVFSLFTQCSFSAYQIELKSQNIANDLNQIESVSLYSQAAQNLTKD